MGLPLNRGIRRSTSYKPATIEMRSTRGIEPKEFLDDVANFVFKYRLDYFGALTVAFSHGFHKVEGLFRSNVPW
jgi:hypothetical protein